MSTNTIEPSQRLRKGMMRKASSLNIPLQVGIELTYRCNLRCTHCYVDLTESDELSTEEWKEIIDQLKAAGTASLIFTGGEIMVRHDILDILTYARDTGFFISILTNCTMLTPDIARSIAKIKVLKISTSLHGATAATHESVTMVPGSFEKTLEGISYLVDAGLLPIVQTVVMENNAAEISLIKKLVADLGAIAQINVGMLGPSKTGANYPFQHEPNIETLFNCAAQQDIRSAINVHEQGNHLTCYAGSSIASVSPHGDVFPCITVPLKLGNLKEASFDSIWHFEPCVELRYLRSMRRSNLFACDSCKLSTYCNRCTGIAYLETGLMNGPSPSACRQAQMRWRLTHATEVT
jgi:radical SAM protein with 4Fe4S-binding SPASM domain